MAVLTLATARGAPDNRLGIHLSGIDGSEARQRHKMEATRKIHEQPHSQHPAYVDAHLLIVVPGSVTDGEVTLRSAWGEGITDALSIPLLVDRRRAGCVELHLRRASWTQSLPDWIGSHVRTPDFLGGVPRQIVCDFVPGNKIGVMCPTPLYGR